MRRAWMLAAALVLSWTLAVPLASAAASLRVSDVHIFSLGDKELELIPLGVTVKIVATVKNTGNAPQEGILQVNFLVRSEDGAYQVTDNVGTPGDVAANETRDVEYQWTATRLGNHSVTASIVGASGTGFLANFRVTETAVPAGNIAQRMLDYWWFFGSFLATIVLFVAVVRTRRT